MKVVISGSFRKHINEILELKHQLEANGIEVLKPDNTQVINNIDDPNFIKFKGEENKSPRELEMEYIKAISECDAHVIFNKDSYIGISAGFEFGYGFGSNCTTYLFEEPDLTQFTSYGDEDSVDFYYILQGMIAEEKVKVGIASLYKDFEVKKKSLDFLRN